MPTSCFLLGPDHWDDGYRPEAPHWLRDLLQATNASGYQPKHLRLYLKEILERDHGKKAVVMDREQQFDGESDGDLFNRLEITNKIDSYLIVVPASAKVLGTVFEGGMLERDFHYGQNPVILLFLQGSYAKKDRHDKIMFNEKGKRTHYLESLAGRAHHVAFWDQPEELIDLVVEWMVLEG